MTHPKGNPETIDECYKRTKRARELPTDKPVRKDREAFLTNYQDIFSNSRILLLFFLIREHFTTSFGATFVKLI